MTIESYERVQNADGKWVQLGPHFTGSTAEKKEDVRYPDDAVWLANRIRYQKEILQRIEDWGLWEHFDTPGRMVGAYRQRRREDIRGSGLERVAQERVRGQMNSESIPERFRYYPVPGFINWKHGVDADWLVDREISDVFAFVLTNTNKDPYHEKGAGKKDDKVLKHLYEERTILVRLDASCGATKLTLGPGRSYPIPFGGDTHAPRGLTDTKLERYEHSNPAHNRALRGTGHYMDGDAFLSAPVEVTSE